MALENWYPVEEVKTMRVSAPVAAVFSMAGSSVLSKASRSVASAVGASPTPETLEDYVEDAKDKVKSVAAKVHVEL